MVSVEDMNFATGILILIAINALIVSPIALIITGIIYAFRKKYGDSFWEIFKPTIGVGAGILTTAYFIYIIVIYFKSCSG